MSEVVDWSGVTRLDSNPDRTLERCIGKLESVIVIGYDADGAEFFASSIADGGTALWLIERAKGKLLAVPDQ